MALVVGFLGVSCLLLIVSGVRALARYLTAKRFGLPIRHFALGFGTTLAPMLFTVAGVPVQLRVPVPFIRVEVSGLTARTADEATQPVKSRALTVLAGIASTALLAWVAFFLAAVVHGDNMLTNRVHVEPSGPAARAGLRDGDVIVGIGGRTVDSRESINEALDALSEPTVRVAVLRDSKREEYVVTPRPGHTHRWELGVVYQMDRTPVGVVQAFGRGFTGPIGIVKGMTGSPPPLATPSPATAQLARLARLTDPILAILVLMGHFATVLTCITILPLPGLDGARLLVLAAEAVRRRPVSLSVDTLASNGALGCLSWGLLSFLIAFLSVWFK